MYDDTIAAIATAAGTGALGVVRLSGPHAMSIASRLFPRPLPDHQVVHGPLMDPTTGALLDDVMATYLAAPRSYTREDMVELSCHGGGATLQRVLAALLAQGARAASPGEFTLRAFLNGRVDLAQAEAVLDVVQAPTPRALDLALQGMAGALSARVRQCRAQVLEVLAYVTAMVDFPEEGIDAQLVEPPLRMAVEALELLLASAGTGMVLRRGVRVAIVGLPNAGKSSLLNRLLGWDRAIVSPAPGTTRDTLEETANLRGMTFVLTDTAGITTAPSDPIEAAGVDRSRRVAAAADVVLLVTDGSLDITMNEQALVAELPPAPLVVAVNKCDLPQRLPPAERAAAIAQARPISGNVVVSAATGAGVDALALALEQAALGRDVASDDLLVANPRQADALRRAIEAVRSALDGAAAATPVDLLAIDLGVALSALGEITGETASDELLDLVFSRFCIGK